MLTAREKILVEGQDDWVQLDRVHHCVVVENLSASLAEVQIKTLDLVRSMAEEGLLAFGDVVDHGATFVPWNIPVDDAIQRLATEYIEHFDDRAGWPWTLWMSLTDEGKRVARTYEHKYAVWLAALRAQGLDNKALPERFAPGGQHEG